MLRTVNSIHPASTLAFRPTPEVSLPRALAPPRTGLAPASYRDLVAQLRHVDSFVLMAPELLDAQFLLIPRYRDRDPGGSQVHNKSKDLQEHLFDQESLKPLNNGFKDS